MGKLLHLECAKNINELRKDFDGKRFLVLSNNKISSLDMGLKSLWTFSQDHEYSFRQILVGLVFEDQWVGKNHSITLSNEAL